MPKNEIQLKPKRATKDDLVWFDTDDLEIVKTVQYTVQDAKLPCTLGYNPNRDNWHVYLEKKNVQPFLTKLGERLSNDLYEMEVSASAPNAANKIYVVFTPKLRGL